MQDFVQIESIILMLKKTVDAIKSSCLNHADLDNIQLIIKKINQGLYSVETLKFQGEYNLQNGEKQQRFADELDKLLFVWEQSISRSKVKEPDRTFWKIYEYFKYVDKNIIFTQALQCFRNLPEGTRIEYLSLPHYYPFLHGKMDIVENDFSLLMQCIDIIEGNLERYHWLYEKLEDNHSKNVLNTIIEFWYTFDLEKLQLLDMTDTINIFNLDGSFLSDEIISIDTGGEETGTIYKEKEKILLQKPRMKIALWHRLDNLFEIPWIVCGIRKDYKLYMDIQKQDGLWPCNYVLNLE